MMPGQKEQAEVLRHGLLTGTRTVSDVIAWADSVIEADPRPDIAVIEVATSGRRHAANMTLLLRDVAGECDPVIVLRRSMSDLRRALATDPSRGPQIARWLALLATTGELSETEFGDDVYMLQDSFAPWGTYESAVKELDAYLAQHA